MLYTDDFSSNYFKQVSGKAGIEVYEDTVVPAGRILSG